MSPAYRIVYVSWPHYGPHIHSGWSQWHNSMSCKISIFQGVGMFGMLDHSYFSSALCAALVRWTFHANKRSICCFFSAHLNPSALLRKAACRGRVFPCCTNDQRQYYRHLTSVPWKMCWVECHCQVDSVLLEWQHKQYNTTQVQGSYTCRSSCRFKTGQWNRKASFRDQHLDVALRANISTRDRSS